MSQHFVAPNPNANSADSFYVDQASPGSNLARAAWDGVGTFTRTITHIGQSLNVRGGRDGLMHGFQRTLLDEGVAEKIYHLQNGVAGTGIVAYPGHQGFWDIATDLPTEHADAIVAAITARPACAPEPDTFIVQLGYSDVQALYAGEVTVAQLTSYMEKLIDNILTRTMTTPANAKLIVTIHGGSDFDSIRSAHHSGVREAVLAYVAGESRATLGAGIHHLPRRLNDPHYPGDGSMMWGMLLGRAYVNARHSGALNLGPQVTAAQVDTTTKVVTLTLAASAGTSLIYPQGDAGALSFAGPNPLGLAIIANGGNAVANQIPITRATVVPITGNGADKGTYSVTLTVDPDTASAALIGGRVLVGAGTYEAGPLGNDIRDSDVVWNLPGQPLKYSLTTIAAAP